MSISDSWQDDLPYQIPRATFVAVDTEESKLEDCLKDMEPRHGGNPK